MICKALVIRIMLISFVFIIYTYEPLYARGGSDNSTSGEEFSIVIGVSLPDQRSSLWVKDRFTMEAFAQEQDVEIIVRFSDHDAYLQAHQIYSLINNGITALIVAAPEHENIIAALEVAKENNIQIISYDTLIKNTSAVDVFVSVNWSSTNVEGDENRIDSIDVEALKRVINQEQDTTFFIDRRILAVTAMEEAIRLSILKGSESKHTNLKDNSKRKKYAAVDNGLIFVPTVYVQAIQITHKNYDELLFQSELFSRDILND